MSVRFEDNDCHLCRPRACLSVLRIMTVLIFLASPTPHPTSSTYAGSPRNIHRLNSNHIAKTVMGDVDIRGTVYDTCSVTVNLAFACGLLDCALTRY